jgi:hypothetical protein
MLPGDLAIDPGVVNLMTVGFIDPRTGKFRTMTLSQGRWYEETGVRSMMRKHASLDMAFRKRCGAQAALDDVPLKTAKSAQVLEHKKILCEHWHDIWQERLRLSRAVARYASCGAWREVGLL